MVNKSISLAGIVLRIVAGVVLLVFCFFLLNILGILTPVEGFLSNGFSNPQAQIEKAATMYDPTTGQSYSINLSSEFQQLNQLQGASNVALGETLNTVKNTANVGYNLAVEKLGQEAANLTIPLTIPQVQQKLLAEVSQVVNSSVSSAKGSLPSFISSSGTNSYQPATNVESLGPVYQPLQFTGSTQFVMSPKDSLGRATNAHIQVSLSSEPSQNEITRPQTITYNPIGWHNYKMNYRENGKINSAWLMNRGHLVGYQFCGVNDDGRNLVPETSWFNSGDYNSINENNSKAMIWFETRLEAWLRQSNGDFLDYEVTPLYNGNNLLPDRIELRYIGISANGHITIPLNFGNSLETTDASGVTRVILDNVSPNAIINYSTGTAYQN